MHQIEVTFPSPSGTPPVVTNMLERGRSNDMIVWDVICCDPKIKYIDIEFDKPRAKFFRAPDGEKSPDTNRIVKKLDPKRGRVQIYGHAPAYENAVRPIQDKYTIRGWSRMPPDPANPKPSGKKAKTVDGPIVELDPLWVTDKP